MWRHGHRTFLFALIVLGVVIVPASPGLAAPPPNDVESGATEIATVPFTETLDTSDARADGTKLCTNNASVYYSFTPAEDVRIQFDTLGSDYDTTLFIYTRNAKGKVQPLRNKCNDDRFGLNAGLRLRATAGVTYYFQVGRCCGNGGSLGGGQLTVTVTEVIEDPIEFSLDVTDPGTVDAATGLATISGTVTCNKRSVIGSEAMLRQLRQDLYVARGSMYLSVGCVPEAPTGWSVEVDTDTGIAFGAGTALLRTYYSYASDGFREYVELAGGDSSIELVAG